MQTLLSKDIILKFEKFISNPDNSRSSALYGTESKRTTAFDTINEGPSGGLLFYGCAGFNEYAFYKSDDGSIYSLTFYATKLSSYFKYAERDNSPSLK